MFIIDKGDKVMVGRCETNYEVYVLPVKNDYQSEFRKEREG